MTERKWTPGPWEVVADEAAAQVKGFPCIYSDDYTVVGTEGMYGDIDQDFANANLIAAAPDLYEALSECVKWLETSAEGDNATRMAFAALAKARGE